MEVVFELIFDLFIEGNKSIAESKRAPRWLRMLALVALGVVIVGLFGGLFTIALLLVLSAEGDALELLIGIFLMLLTIAFIILTGFKAIRFLRSMRNIR